jgi:hypothetical protein
MNIYKNIKNKKLYVFLEIEKDGKNTKIAYPLERDELPIIGYNESDFVIQILKGK